MSKYKVLVTGPSWIGDMVVCQSLFKLLHENIPDLIIDVLAPAWTLPILERMSEVRKGICFESRHGKLDLKMRIKTGLSLRDERYDEAIIIPRSLKSVLPSVIAGIKKRTGLKSHFGLINNVKYYNKKRNELFVRRYLALGSDKAYLLKFENIPKPSLDIDLKKRALLLNHFNLENNKFVVFAPGAEYGPAKQWPAEYYSRLADLIETKKLQVCIVGSDKDKIVSQKIISIARRQDIIDLCGKTSLTEVVDIMSASKNVVTNDSGVMHLASACNAKIIAIFGSTSPKYTPPLSNEGSSKTVNVEMECSPCFGRVCKFGHYNCLKQIEAPQVFKALCSL